MPERLPLWPILLCALAVFFDGYEAQMLAMAIPLLAKHLAVPPTVFAIAASASLAGMAIGALVLGPLSDRFGRKPMLLVSLLLFGGGTLAALTIRSPIELAAWRLLAGCGLGAAVPVTIALVTEWAPAAKRVRIVTVMAMGFPIGASSAGLIAPVLTSRWGWEGLFVYGGIGPLIIAALIAISVREPPRSLTREKPVWRRVGDLFSSSLRSRTLLFCALNVVNLFANYGLASWLPTLLVQNGWTLAAASRATSVLAIGGLTSSFLASGLADRGRIGLGLGCAYLVVATGLAPVRHESTTHRRVDRAARPDRRFDGHRAHARPARLGALPARSARHRRRLRRTVSGDSARCSARSHWPPSWTASCRPPTCSVR